MNAAFQPFLTVALPIMVTLTASTWVNNSRLTDMRSVSTGDAMKFLAVLIALSANWITTTSALSAWNSGHPCFTDRMNYRSFQYRP